MKSIFNTSNLQINNIQYDDLSLLEDEVTFLSGPSGCGKSTLLKLFNGTLSPGWGTVYYDGKDISAMDSISLRKEVSLVTQEVFLFNTTIEGNFKEFYAYRELSPPGRETMMEYLALCCLDLPLDALCTSMSGGERQRVYLAIFLSLRPKVLMLDEPTSALDQKNSLAMLESILHHCKENHITLIIVSHDLSLAEKYADRKIDFSYLCRLLDSDTTKTTDIITSDSTGGACHV